MRNLLKISLLGCGIAMSVISCDPPKTTGGVVDTSSNKPDTLKKDSLGTKADSAKKDSVKR